MVGGRFLEEGQSSFSAEGNGHDAQKPGWTLTADGALWPILCHLPSPFSHLLLSLGNEASGDLKGERRVCCDGHGGLCL